MTGSESLPLPRNLVVAAEQQGRTAWLTTLPATVARLTRAWSLSVEVPFQPGGQTAWVAPARDRAGAEMVLKVAWAHPEALHEGEGLQLWAGHGAVRLHALEKSADTTALLLERCRPGTPLAALPEPRQDEVAAGLLRRLWQTPVGESESRFRPLQVMCEQWADEFEARIAAGSVRGLPGCLSPSLAMDTVGTDVCDERPVSWATVAGGESAPLLCADAVARRHRLVPVSRAGESAGDVDRAAGAGNDAC